MLFRTMRGKGDGRDVEQQGLVSAVECAAGADRHGPDGVAMIAVVHHDHAMPRFATMKPVTQGHFQGDFNACRSGIGKEHARQAFRHQGAETIRQFFGRTMCPAREDYLV